MAAERRVMQIPSVDVSIRTDDDGKKHIRGHAAVYYNGTPGTEFRLWRDTVERIAEGAFDGVLNQDIRVLFNHDANYPLGRTSAKTSRIGADDIGLWFECDPPESRADVVEAIERGDVSGCSFSFSIYGEGGKTSWARENNTDIRTIEKVAELYDVGPVTFPAYEATDVSARDAETAKAEHDRIKAERDSADTKQAEAATAQARATADYLDLTLAIKAKGA